MLIVYFALATVGDYGDVYAHGVGLELLYNFSFGRGHPLVFSYTITVPLVQSNTTL